MIMMMLMMLMIMIMIMHDISNIIIMLMMIIFEIFLLLLEWREKCNYCFLATSFFKVSNLPRFFLGAQFKKAFSHKFSLLNIIYLKLKTYICLSFSTNFFIVSAHIKTLISQFNKKTFLEYRHYWCRI